MDRRSGPDWNARAWRRRRLASEALVSALFPETPLEGTPWLEAWREQEARVVLVTSRVLFALTSVAFVAHWFLVDTTLHLQPAGRWAAYRFASSGLYAALALATFLPALRRPALSKIPVLVFALVIGTMQAKTVEWLPVVPSAWAFALTVVPLVLARLSAAATALTFLAYFAVQWVFAWRYTEVTAASLASVATVSLVVLVVTRARMTSDVRAFLTERREVDAQRRLIETQIELDRVKTNFFTNVSHELRTPLTLILAPLEALLSSTRALPRDVRSELELMHRNAERLLRHINALLHLARLDAKREFLRLDDVDPVDLLRSIVDSSRALAAQRNIQLRFLPDEPIPRLPLDREKIEQIAMNLLGNALRFTDGTERRPGHVTIRCGVRGAFFWFEVDDDGVGIPADQIDKVFDRFHQVPGHAARGGGTGIGLALVKELAEFHMGTVAVRSKLGRGSTFSVDLPVDASVYPPERLDRRHADQARPAVERRRTPRPRLAVVHDVDAPALAPAEETAPAPAPAPANAPLILVVDDNREMLEFLRRQLSPRFRVQVAESADEALRHTVEEVPALVLSDVMMPGRSGTDLLRDLRTDPRTRHVPVVLITAKADLETKIRNLEEGADDYVTKPFSILEVSARIRSLLAKRQLERDLADKNDYLAKVNFDLVLSKRQVFLETMEAFALAVEAKDPYTHGHSRRVAILAERLTAEMGLSDKDREMVRIAGILHDVGKIGTPEVVLAKPGRLLSEEYETFKKHSALGHRIVSAVKELDGVGKAILHHHERFDGAGYPAGLDGHDIPVLSRILAVCDTYDAMTSDRPYRASLGHRAAIDELVRCSGTQFDPDCVRAFLRLYEAAEPSYPAFTSGLRELAGVDGRVPSGSGGLGTNIPTRRA
ncbi:MAG TPA: HD domain-containing phosphohydrolase [Anaeromyxobacter sp.]|nr:HD domain-containing phosphohydrolase [Anaeromyxobacter sp.]